MTTAALSAAPAKKPRRNRRRRSARWARAGLLVLAVGVSGVVIGQTTLRMLDTHNASKVAAAP